MTAVFNYVVCDKCKRLIPPAQTDYYEMEVERRPAGGKSLPETIHKLHLCKRCEIGLIRYMTKNPHYDETVNKEIEEE